MIHQEADDENAEQYPSTPNGRYFIVRDRLWRKSNPALSETERQALVNELMDARRAVAAAKRANDRPAEIQAHARVNESKIALGERGPAWWADDAPDYNQRLARNTPYADWAKGLRS